MGVAFQLAELTGWKIVALADPAPSVVEDGATALRQRAYTTEHTFVTSERKHSDFILELDVKDDNGRMCASSVSDQVSKFGSTACLLLIGSMKNLGKAPSFSKSILVAKVPKRAGAPFVS